MDEQKKVCVTGSSGFVGSSIVKQLLERGYTVHATLRNLGDASKVAMLKGLPYADKNLVLFQADIYNPDEFEAAIQGCEAVMHMATPLQHNADCSSQMDGFIIIIPSALCEFYGNVVETYLYVLRDCPLAIKYKNTTEAAVAGVKSIAESCIRSGTVKRLIYTASIVAASPLKEDGTGYKDSMDETCWTPLNLSFAYSNDFLMDYVHSKTSAEKELLRYNSEKLKVVSLVCGLVAGETIQSTLPLSMRVLLAQFFRDEGHYQFLRFMEELSGKMPIVHVQDVNSAHIFCMENSALTGRFLCVAAFLKSSEIAAVVQRSESGDNDVIIDDEFVEDSMREISLGYSKLEKFGFQYKYDAEMVIIDSVRCARESTS